jgi:inorganic pyrophosphatase
VCRGSQGLTTTSVYASEIGGVNAMDDQTESDEKILTFDVPDEALERAASAERQAVTWVYCTNGYYWYDCNWPQ